MALSKIVKIADGMTNQYMVSFELGYIKQSDITCQVNEEVDGTGAPIYRSLVFLSPEIIQVGGAPQVSGDTVTFTRTVDRTQLIVNYEDGDVMNDENMNTAQKQAIMLIHELLDGRFERFDSGFDMGGNSITGLPVPVNPTDASNKQYVDDRVADNQQVAVDAAASAAAAAGSAGTASSAASAALGWKDKAQEWAISGTIVDSLDYSAKWWANQANTWAQAVNPTQFVLKAGGIMSGPLKLENTYPNISFVDTTAPVGKKGFGVINSGGYLHISTVADDGLTWESSPVQINRETKQVGFAVRPVFGINSAWDIGNLPNPINDAPSDNATYARKNAAWVKSVGGAIMSDTAPPSPENGQKWINTLTMREYTWYVDANSAQWVETTNSDAQRPASDGNDYVMRNGVWVLANRQLITSGKPRNTSLRWVEMDIPAGYESFELNYGNCLTATASSYVALTFRVGSTWYESSANYAWTSIYASLSSHAKWDSSTGGSSVIVIGSNAIIQSGAARDAGNVYIRPGTADSAPTVNARWSQGAAVSQTAGHLGVNGRINGMRIWFTNLGEIKALDYELHGNRG